MYLSLCLVLIFRCWRNTVSFSAVFIVLSHTSKQNQARHFSNCFFIVIDALFNMYHTLDACCSSLRVDYERIKAIGPDRAAAEWLLRCGAKVRFQGFDRWHHDYNGLPTGPLGRYKIQAIDATESCIMYRGFDHLGQCYSVENNMFLSLSDLITS